MDPLFTNSIYGGFKNNEKFLGLVDMFGNTYQGNYLVTGLAHHFCGVLLENKWREDMSEAEGIKLLEECARVLHYRETKASDIIQITKVNAAGVDISEPYRIKSDMWDIGSFKEMINEKTRDMQYYY
jgi:20S proteasome subunit beta 7